MAPVMKINQIAPTTKLVRDLPQVREMVRNGPVAITSHNRTEFVMLSKGQFDSLVTLADTDADRLDTKLRLTFDSIATMAVVLNEDLTVRRANRAFCDFLGEPCESLVGQRLNAINGTTLAVFVAARTREVLRSGQEENFEVPSSLRPDRILSHRIKPWPNGVAIFIEDVTHRIMANNRHLRTIAIDEALAAIGNVCVCTIDKRGEFGFFDGSMAAVLGVDRNHMAGRNFLRALMPDDKQRVEDYLSRNTDEVFRDEVCFLYRGAERYRAQLSLKPFPNMHAGRDYALTLMRGDRIDH